MEGYHIIFLVFQKALSFKNQIQKFTFQKNLKLFYSSDHENKQFREVHTNNHICLKKTWRSNCQPCDEQMARYNHLYISHEIGKYN